MKDLAGKTAVITGAASGMGRAFAERFAEAGMNIVLADVEVPRLEEATASVTARGVEAIGVPTDVSDADAVERLRDAALARFGRVNVLCNNAAVAGSMSGVGVDLEDAGQVGLGRGADLHADEPRRRLAASASTLPRRLEGCRP